jgi:hypothetical protein
MGCVVPLFKFEAIQEGDRVGVNLTTGDIFDLTQKRIFLQNPFWPLCRI